jgi:D-alanyl-D-alanine carboxypeptidase/L,D-transpeptidase catalytic domain
MPEDEPIRRFYAVRYEDDIPKPGKGMLIPYQRPLVPRVTHGLDHYAGLILVPVAALLFVFTAGVLGTQTYGRLNTAALPAVTVINPFTEEVTPLNYGVQLALSQPNFFAETRDAFIESEVTFIEADLTAMQLRYFEDGVLAITTPILAKGDKGTLWQTPAGLYQVEKKDEKHYSTFGHMYQPWSMTFQGNFFIHGWPQYEDGVPVPADFRAGGIRLDDADMARLYQQVKINTPILVHEVDPAAKAFVYEPKVPELITPQYLIADMDSSTVLAGNNLDTIVPIASLTKLMTALVAAEFINLDTSVSVEQPTFVHSLIPRLGDRSKVSMYSLLQLLLVESSNEAAEVIAAQVGRDKFIKFMNEKAKALGMIGTQFADPSGLSASNTSSVSDLLRLAQYIQNNRSFIFELTANQNVATTYTSGEFGELVNFNKVADLDNFIGGKVGETLAAGQTSVTLHNLRVKDSDRILAIIILGSSNRHDDVTKLYHYAEERFGQQ